MMKRLAGFICFSIVACCVWLTRVLAQTPGGGVVINGASPWVDVLAYGAKCDGQTDDTAAIQTLLNNFNTAGYGRMFVPYTGNPCVIMGYSATFTGQISSAGQISNLSLTLPSWVAVGAPVVVYNTAGGCTGTSNDPQTNSCNGVWLISAINSSTSISLYMPGIGLPSSTGGGSVSIGLWTSGIVSIEGECTTRFSSSGDCSGLATPAGGSPIYLVSSVPVVNTSATNALSLRNLSLKDGGTSANVGKAFGGVYMEQPNGFEISGNNFQNFTASSNTALGAGAAITLDGFTQTSAAANSYVQNGFVVNNKMFNDKFGVTFRFLVTGNTFLMNHATCYSPSSSIANQIISGSIGFDGGYTWVGANKPSFNTGGENTWLGNQVEGCQIGYAVDDQNFDRIWSKAEIVGGNVTAGAPVGNALAFSVLGSSDITLGVQSKSYCVGWHEDINSSYVNVQNPQMSPPGGSQGCGTISADGGSYTYAADVVDSTLTASTAITTTSVIGLLDPVVAATWGGTQPPTFANDYDPIINSYINTITTAGNYPATLTDQYIVCNPPSGTVTITLPITSPLQVMGKQYRIKNVGTTGPCMVTVQGGGTIDNLTQFPLNQWQAITVVYNGSEYYTF